MTSYTISPIWGAGAQLFDNSGNVLSGGKIYTYLAGTTTPATTYTNPIGTIANSNPIIANAAGRLTNEIWLPVTTSYKFVLKDANDVLIATYDNVPAAPQPAVVNDASGVYYEEGYEVTAGNFTVGATYLITSVGTTDFVAIGAAANVTGIHFIATGVGSGTGTAKFSRTVESKLQEFVSVKDFGAVGDGVTNDTAAIQAAIDSGAGCVYIPSGEYKVTSTITVTPSASFKIYGDGGTTILQATAFTGAVLELRPNNLWNTQEFIVSQIKIQATSITSGQFGIYSNSSNGTSGVRMDNVYAKNFDVAFKLVGNQFCSFSNLSGTTSNVGLYLTQDITGGGGNNNTFYDCWFSYNQVGVVLDQPSPYPHHNVKFINLTTHVNSVCPFYSSATSNVSIENWAPEGNGSGASTYTFAGHTIKNSILHLTSSAATLRNYQCTSNTQVLYVESTSNLCFDGVTGASQYPVVDATSVVTFTNNTAIWYQGYVNSILTNLPYYTYGGIYGRFTAVPNIKEASWLPNDAIEVAGKLVDIGYYSSGTFCTTSYVTDSEMGYVQQASFSGSGSGNQLNINTKLSGSYVLGQTILFSCLVKSSSNTAKWNINFAQNTSASDIILPANQWVRIVLIGGVTVASRSANVIITPDVSAIGETLRICKIQTNEDLTAPVLSNVVANGLYNPGSYKTTKYYLSAAPSTGTWAVGDLVYNTTPSSGGYIGWVCTVAGTPGTWKGFGAIA